MKPKLVYLQTCQPDYFQGFGGQVFVADAIGRVRDVLADLQRDIDASWDGWIPDAQRYATDEEWGAVYRAVRELFKGANRSKSWANLNRRDNDGAQAFFGLKWED